MNRELSITFWGVRGSTPTPSLDYMQYGGNTTCYEITIGDETIVIDLGTGSRLLGQKITKRQQQLSVLFSHLHFDHLLGLPFFSPLYMPNMHIDLYSAIAHFGYGDLQSFLNKTFAPPIFPIPYEKMPAKKQEHAFTPGQVIVLPSGVEVRTLSIPHPNGCVGFRFDHAGRSIVILCDMMPLTQGQVEMEAFVAGADLLVMDGAFSEQQYSTRTDWGHCCWNYCVEFMREYGAKRLAITHHDILNPDEDIAQMEREAQRLSPDSVFAREGMTIAV